MTAPVSTLRGGGVAIDSAKALRVVVALCLAGLAATAGALFVAGANKNAQIDRLRSSGVPISITVSRCLGELGGSGSNMSSFACEGGFERGGHHYEVSIPGSSFRRPGSTVAAVSARNDPRLVDLPSTVASERSSAGVYLLPGLLSGALLIALAATVIRHRRATGGSATRTSAT
jgi:hypothetical protein